MDINERIERAIERITSGQGSMRVPVDDTDVDIVLSDAKAALSAAIARAEAAERAMDEAREDLAAAIAPTDVGGGAAQTARAIIEQRDALAADNARLREAALGLSGALFRLHRHGYIGHECDDDERGQCEQWLNIAIDADRRLREALTMAGSTGDLAGTVAVDSASAENARLLRFVAAYDAWALSDDHCGGRLFDAMLEARDATALRAQPGEEVGGD